MSRLRDNGLWIVNLGLFAVFFVGMVLTGWHVYNAEQLDHGSRPSGCGYLTSRHFVEAIFENWECEFLQMGMYVLLTVSCSSRARRSRRPTTSRTAGRGPAGAAGTTRRAVAGPPGRLGPRLRALALAAVLPAFFASFVAARGRRGQGVQRRSRSRTAAGRRGAGIPRHRAVLVRVAAELAERVPRGGRDRGRSIFLRERGSPESKPVHAPHRETGD